MAVQSDTSRISYAGNNSTTTSYAVPFVFLENSHLKAIARSSAGVESVVTLTNHTGAGNVNGGTVRTSVAIPATSTLTIYRDVPITQTTTYAEGGDFPAASHERALDKLTQISQQNARQIGSSIRFSESTQLNPINPPVSATPHVLTTVNGGAPTWETVPSVSFPDSLNALTDATTVNAADELIIQQGGITKRATGAELAKGLNAINGTVNVKDFGAVGDGVADDTAALQAAITHAANNRLRLVFSSGTYLFTSLSYAGEGVADWEAHGSVILRSTKTSPNTTSFDADHAIRLSGSFVTGAIPIVGDNNTGTYELTVSGSHSLAVGDIAQLRSTRVIESENRSTAREGQTCLVDRVSGNTIGLRDSLLFPAHNKADLTDTIASAASTTQFTFSTLTTPNERTAALMTFTSGSLSGQSRYIRSYNPSTKTAIFDSRQAWPSTPSNGDSFTISWRTTIAHYKPISVRISGAFTITRAPTYNATAGDLGFRGLEIAWAKECNIHGITVENFSETGISITHCYKPYVSHVSVYNANRAYSTFDGTGYGVACNNSFYPIIESSAFSACRRAVDFGGTQAITWGGKCSNISVAGGGRDYTGTSFYPAGATQNFGVGSHGAGHNSMYVGCALSNLYLGVGLRGMRETASGNAAFGRMFSFARLYGGSEHRLIGNTYSTSDAHKFAAAYDPSAYELPAYFAEIDTDSISQNATFYIENNNATLSNGFIRLNGSQSEAPTLVTANNLCNFDRRNSADAADVRFLSTVQSFTVKDLIDKGGNIINLLSETRINDVYKYQISASIAVADGSVLRMGENRYFVKAAIDTISTVQLTKRSDVVMVSVWDYFRDRSYRAANVLLYEDRSVDYSPLEASNKVNVVISSAVPTVATNETNSRVSLYLSDDKLYITNRVVNPANMVITIDAITV